MRKLLKSLAVLGGGLAIAILVFLIWAYTPVATFEPAKYDPQGLDYWPTEAWRYSTPEDQGVRSDALVGMMASYRSSAQNDPNLFIDSITIIRNGYVIADFYQNPLYPRDELHVIHSVVKSIVSTLIGIAIDQGHIASVDTPVIEVFSDLEIENLDDRKRAITIRDLLTMQTGMHSRDSYLYGHEGLFALQHSDDWLQHALSLPMAAVPGERFDYSNISTFLLSAIIAESTGMDTLAYARKHLFGPLGIEDVKWEWNSENQPIAWARMWLKPNDLAKIGLLYLQQGRWDGRQIISADWVAESLTPQAYPKNVVDILNKDMSRNQEASSRNWIAQRFFRPCTDGYGYQWWLDRRGHYCAMGTSGQFLIVAPNENLIVVALSKSKGLAQFAPAALFEDFILEAVESGTSLPASEASLAELAGMAGPPVLTKEVSAVPALPQVALAVSGVTYRTESNPFNTDNIRFIFHAERDFAELSYTAREDWAVDYRIGLDNVRRFTRTNDSTFAAVGSWIAPDTFEIEVEIVGYSTFDRWQFKFDNDTVMVTEFSISGTYTYAASAT
ncbi:MAG: serine hydrolase [Woeseiaceae bacterium]|nr:serine hydrolase [Woeseiaceae bacterium]